MDFLKQELAPITDKAWEEIDNYAKDVFLSSLSARKIVDVIGPKGWDFSSVNIGRLDIPVNHTKYGVKFGLRQVKPLIETRSTFQLDMMELDLISRGAENPNFDPIDEAVKNASKFEDKAIYEGFEEGDIKGFFPSAEHILPYPKKKMNT